MRLRYVTKHTGYDKDGNPTYRKQLQYFDDEDNRWYGVREITEYEAMQEDFLL